ncbi:MAG TPA: hypothetical protein VFF98_17615 [Novosphingobium sp.]|nr:hypothetical protein [Novosphingobium sp.]
MLSSYDGRMNEGSVQSIAADPAEAALCGELARGDAVLQSVDPVLRHLLMQRGGALFADDVLARVKGMLADMACQLLDAGQLLDASGGEAAVSALAGRLADVPGLLGHLHAQALEWQVAQRLQAQLGLDPVLSPLLQALVGSTQPDVAALAMRLLAAQARFARQISRMQWPLAELPGDLLHAVLAAWEAEGGATAAVREAYEEGHTRHALAARLVTMMGAGALAALLPGHAGVALFASAVAQGAQGARDLAVLAMQEGQKTRLALMLRAGGAPPATVEDALLALFGGSAEDAELARVGAEKAARLLTSGAATGAV